MTPPDRPPSRLPALAYDYRRVILLVQVLAMEGSDEPIRQLCEQWNIEPVYDLREPPYKGKYYLNVWATLRKLAQHALEHGRMQERSSTTGTSPVACD